MKKLDIPVIKSFVHRGGYYVYDAFTNRLISVTKAHFSEIKLLEKVGIKNYCEAHQNSIAEDDILLLMEKGMLKPPFIERIEHPETPYIDELTSRCINNLVLQVTQNCNFRCRYCLYAGDSGVERVHNQINMSYNTARKAIDFLVDHSFDAREINIAFYGGEPLLNIQLIKQVINYVDSRFLIKPVNYGMTINGSLLNDDVVNILIMHNISISISLDGPAVIQNRHRKFRTNGEASFDVVFSNTMKLKTQHPTYFEKYVSFLPVVFEDENYDEVLRFSLRMAFLLIKSNR